MKAAEFAKRRERIERAPRSKQWRARAFHRLVQEAGAVVVVSGHNPIGWQLLNGDIVCKKRRYKNQEDAEHHLAMIQVCGASDVKPQRSYFCNHCSGWHLTSRPAMIANDA